MRKQWACVLGFLVAAGCGDVVDKPKDTCDTAAMCMDSAAPYCVDQHCSAACAVATDCTVAGAAICATDGVCVGCVANSDCGAASPVCDTTARACRGCTTDSECAGGVCIEADGTCTADASVAFVTMMGNDTAACTRTAPCATIAHALTAGKPVVHVLGGSLSSSTVSFAGDRILDAENTTLSVGTASSSIIVQSGNVTVEGVRMSAPTTANLAAVTAATGSHVRLYNVQISGGGSLAVNASSATLEMTKSHVGSLTGAGATVSCPNSVAKIDQNVFENSIVDDGGAQCELTVTRNRFESQHDGSVRMMSGTLVMENNLVIHSDGFNDSVSLQTLRPGSTIRYNTFVNTTAVSSDGSAIYCGASVAITSNIFAYNSGHPITGVGCTTKYSVFDNIATTGAGTGNQLVGIDTIFANRAAGDYHLAATSVAKGGAEPGLTMTKVDFDGKPRPNPTGSTADSGAFEAP